MRDGWLSWRFWLTDSGRLNHKVVTRPASSLAQDRESSPAETSVLTTMLCRQLGDSFDHRISRALSLNASDHPRRIERLGHSYVIHI